MSHNLCHHIRCHTSVSQSYNVTHRHFPKISTNSDKFWALNCAWRYCSGKLHPYTIRRNIWSFEPGHNLLVFLSLSSVNILHTSSRNFVNLYYISPHFGKHGYRNTERLVKLVKFSRSSGREFLSEKFRYQNSDWSNKKDMTVAGKLFQLILWFKKLCHFCNLCHFWFLMRRNFCVKSPYAQHTVQVWCIEAGQFRRSTSLQTSFKLGYTLLHRFASLHDWSYCIIQ